MPTNLITTYFLLGLGREGWSSYKYLKQVNPEARFVITDDKAVDKLGKNWQAGINQGNVEYVSVDDAIKQLSTFDQTNQSIVLSPGIPLFHRLCLAIDKFKFQPTSNTELFLQAILNQSTPPLIIGVTGTKGKSTTASLIHHVLNSTGNNSNLLATKNGRHAVPIQSGSASQNLNDHNNWKIMNQFQDDVHQSLVDFDKNSKYTYHLLAGNIGTPPLEILPELEKLSQNFSSPGTVTLEMSSHQLRLLHTSPKIAVIQNISQEHLDHFGSFEKYVEAKSSIVRFQAKTDLVVFNQDLEAPTQLAFLSPAKKLTFVTRDLNEQISELSTENQDRSYVNSKPNTSDGMLKQVHHDGIIVEDDEQETTLQPIAWIANGVIICDGQPVIDIDQLPLLGRHNWQNVMPAVVIGHHLGLSHSNIAQAIKTFQPLKHRLQKVAEIEGVLYVNDTLATGPAAASAALKSFPDRPIIALAGGFDRGLDLTDHIEQLLTSNIKGLILFPTTGDRMATQMQELSDQTHRSINFPIHHVKSMSEAISIAKSLAQPGDVVLLSPGAASFGLFKDYADRGDQFIQNAIQKEN